MHARSVRTPAQTEGEEEEGGLTVPSSKISPEFFQFLTRDEATEALSKSDLASLEKEGVVFRGGKDDSAPEAVHENLRARVRYY